MTINKKPAPGGTGAGSNTANSVPHFISTPDPLKGRLDLAAGVKDSRNRKPKRGWRRGARQ